MKGSIMKDILLHIDSYPEPTSEAAIQQAVGFASAIGARISALAVRVAIRPSHHSLANALLGLGAMAAQEQAKSARACEAATAYFETEAKKKGVFESSLIEKADYHAVGDFVASRARTRDLCIVPVLSDQDGQRAVAEAVIFASGRPTIIFGYDAANLPQSTIGTIVLAWDNSRTAARAMADAMPLLKQAKEVRVMTVINEKPAATTGIGADVVRHLRLHGVKAAVDEVEIDGKSIGATLDSYLDRVPCDLLVMGAYGRSLVREFILGGATAHVLARAKRPLFLVH
jgi:nucleotide-binding universal stress UspA family protein